eukprot:TRINITY_DN6297_c0_g1_i2.p1 TRINITY_DN6297_c0_g1~~TRINITY_DN6297_c0_g1_i2.p1  ORF type:complete len:201 (+),score=42.96 TRINITY_DN6297_c0_g1_i2:393-995(+)
MTVTHEATGMDSNDEEEFLTLSREFKCSCLCLQRPAVDVFWTEEKEKKKLGTIISPYEMCDYTLHVLDKHENVTFRIVASCCQLGFHCNFPCDACQNIDFYIKNSDGSKNLGYLKKRSPGCIQAATTTADNFHLEFPGEAKAEERALLLAATLFMDFRFFEEKQPRKEEGNDQKFCLIFSCAKYISAHANVDNPSLHTSS